ncbi:MAG: DUF4249 domain-containing protein [Prolixibacteraceae bacterium]
MTKRIVDIPMQIAKQRLNTGFVLLKNGFLFLSMLSVLLGLSSCEKVIQLDLNNTTPRIVIEGTIYDHRGPYTIKISRSVNFDESSVYPPVTGARVEISDNIGQTEILSESKSGTYVTSDLRGIPGHIYQLTVKTAEGTFSSSATMPAPVEMDSIYFSLSPFSGDKVTTVRFTDPPFTKNFYRLVYIINKVQQQGFYLFKDELFQGSSIRYSLNSRGSDIKLLNGDSVTVWLESIDDRVFEYFRTVGTDGGQSASPSNPVSNISNGALGYFNACSVRAISAKVGK